MIKVNYTADEDMRTISLLISGHAGQSEHGRDIVCASASILVYSIADIVNNAEGLTEKVIRLDSGDSEVSCVAEIGSYEHLLNLYSVVVAGFRLLANNYPQFVELKLVDKA